MDSFQYKKRFGQNFISDTNLLKSLVAAAGVGGDDCVLEVGAGAGSLTRELCAAARFVVSYEIDRELQPALTAALSGIENIKVVFADALKAEEQEIVSLFQSGPQKEVSGIRYQVSGKGQENQQQLLTQVNNEQGTVNSEQFKLVANLPYYITAPLIFKFLEMPACLGMAVMVQEEVADRLTAKEGTESYGALTAAVAVAADVKVLKHVGRKLFYPTPDVDSCFVSIKRDDKKFDAADRGTLSKLIKCAFAMRRKTLVNNLMSGFGLSRGAAEGLLKAAGLPVNMRGEALSPAKFVELSDIISGKLKAEN